jgi:hypothetical protein
MNQEQPVALILSNALMRALNANILYHGKAWRVLGGVWEGIASLQL